MAAAAVVLLCTTPTLAQGRRLAHGLLTRHLAACITCLPGAASAYWWQGRIERARETIMIIKTARRQAAAALRFLKSAHPYTVPELIALPIVAGDPAYLSWLQQACRG